MKETKEVIYYLLALIIPIPEFLNILVIILYFICSFLEHHSIELTLIDTFSFFVILGLIDSLIVGVKNKF